VTLDVHVSLVNTNQRELLRRCLASLTAACERIEWGVTVVDNMSDDGSAEMVASEFPSVRLIRNAHRLGFSANHNQVLGPVVRNGSARWVFVLNEDTELAPGSVGAMVAHGESEARIGAVGPVVLDPRGSVVTSFYRFPTATSAMASAFVPTLRRPAADDAGWLQMCGALYLVDALRDVGLPDERFFIFFEDADLGLRLHRAGWRSTVCQDARMLHHEHQTVQLAGGPMDRQMRRSRHLYFRKHHGRVAAVAVSAAGGVGLLTRSAKALVTGLLRRDREELTHGKRLLWLAAYRPTAPLPHERAQRS
jgi:GT2 family glycosyltransferase